MTALARAPLHVLRALTQLSPDAVRDAALDTYAAALAKQSSALRAPARVLGIRALAEQRVADDEEHAAAMLDDALARAVDAHSSEWPELNSLREHGALPTFPLAALPQWIATWVRAVAHFTQTPPDMAAMLALAALAVACARRLRIEVRPGWSEPTGIYTCVVQPPGSRKSAVFREATAPINAYESELAERMAPEVGRSRAARETAEQRLAQCQRRAAGASGAERLAAEQDVRDAVGELDACEIITTPRLVCGNLTQEPLAALLAANGGSLAVMDAEGIGPIGIMLGRYTSGMASVDFYLSGHAGDCIRVDRMSREPIAINDPALTVAVTAQPEVLRQLGERREMRGLGLLARFAWCVPTSTVGSRLSDPEPVPDHVRAEYARRLRELLDMPAEDGGARLTVGVSAEALAVLTAFQERIEPRLGPGADLAHVADWASKLAGLTARIACLLHAAEHGANVGSQDVSAASMVAAVKIGEHLLAHALAALGSIGADPTIADAEHILDWLHAQHAPEVSRRDLYRGVRSRFRGPEAMTPALELLTDHGHIRMRGVVAGGAVKNRSKCMVELRPQDTRDKQDARVQPQRHGASSVRFVPSVQESALSDDAEVCL